MRQGRPWWSSPVIHAALLAAVCLGIYSNNLHHEFHLDDSHVLASNLKVRSLANIPEYFTDPSTFTSLRANVDYRPVLQVTYALNYAMGGYNTWWWHLTQILLHFACALGLYFLCRRILQLNRSGEDDPDYAAYVPLLAALVFAVHPTASGVVNYLSARSSLLTAAFLFPSILLYMAPGAARSRRTPWLAALFYALALFTKVEAVACLALFFLYEVWQTAIARKHQGHFFADLTATLNRQTLRRLWPMLAVALAYFVIRQQVMVPFQLDESRRPFGVSWYEYLMTQTVVWWQYVLNWFAPVNLVADQGNYPVYRSLVQGPVPLAIGGWLAIGAALLGSWKARPYLAFLAISALGLLSPTSSIAPLSEMLNEHRPYLPLAVLSLCWMIPLGTLLVRTARTQPVVGAVSGLGAAVVLFGLGGLTWQRNKVFATNRSYLEDVVRKAPSGRALNNYGLIFMREGDYQKALEYFLAAEKYTPYWHTMHVNLGIVYSRLGDTARAEKQFDSAVEYDKFSGTALSWRAEHYLELKRYQDAARDFEQAGPKSLERYRLCKGLATAYAGLGDAQRSFDYTRECFGLDPSQAVLDATAIVKPFFDSTALAPVGIAYFERYDKLLPDTWWIHYNIGTLAARMGDTARASAEHARGEALKSRK